MSKGEIGATPGGAERLTARQYLLLLVQLGLIAYAAYALHIEERHGLPLLLPLVVVGFAVHALLPRAWQPAFFLFLSLVSIPLVLGLAKGLALVVVGLGLFALCHLPGRWNVVALLGATAVLGAARIDLIPIPQVQAFSPGVLPLLAAMFMFRTAIYIHDLRHEKKPASLQQRLSYFFMLPNICFPLFPVVDYRTFLREYYSAPALATYQKGLGWILRGIVHLLLYRLVYFHWTPSFEEVHDLWGVVQYVVSSYLLYLRVSGMFHIAVGIICLFGYNLPETHRLYFLASSFTDFWRRINIYWKDFVMKVLYYPLFMRLKKRGLPQAVMIASLITLICSWLLHSYQTFWLQGTFPLTIQDAVFWSFLGIAVAINAVLELNRGRARPGAEQRSAREAVILSAKTVGMFCFMSVLWSFWSTSSIAEWSAVMKVAGRSGPMEILAFIAGLGGLVALGTAVQLGLHKDWTLSAERQVSFGRAAASTAAVALCLVILSGERMGTIFTADNLRVWVSLTNRPVANAREQEMQTRGYYEELLGSEDTPRSTWTLQGAPLVKRYASMVGVSGLAEAVHGTGDVRRYELRPSIDISYKGAPFQTNRWGMRDKDYEEQPAAGTCRILLFGDSHTMGSGVPNGSTYEALLEARMNQEDPIESCSQYEILNLGVASYSSLQSAVQARLTIPRFHPDVVIYASSQPELQWTGQRLALAITENVPLTDDFLRDIVARVGVADGMNEYEIRQRLHPIQEELLGWAYRTMVESAREHGAMSIWVFLPRFDMDAAAVEADFQQLGGIARNAGFVPMSVADAFNGHDQSDLQTAPWDKHPNAQANELIAARLYQGLVANLDQINERMETDVAIDAPLTPPQSMTTERTTLSTIQE